MPGLLCPLALACLLLILFIEAIWAFVRDVSRSIPIPALSVMVAAACFSISNVSIGTMSELSMWREGVVRVVVECTRCFAAGSVSFPLCNLEGSVLINPKKSVLVELLSKPLPSGA